MLWRQLFRFDTKQSLPVIIVFCGLFGKEQEGKRMTMEKELFRHLGWNEIVDDSTYEMILELTDEVEREKLIIQLERRAFHLGREDEFKRLLKAHLAREKRQRAEKRR